MENEFLGQKITWPIIKFAIPVMLSLLLQALYSTVDLIVVGQFDSTASAAAVATGGQIFYTFVSLLIGVATGASILIGQYLGAKKLERASEVVASMIKILLPFSLLLPTILYFLTPIIHQLMNVPPESTAAFDTYFRICLLGYPLLAIYNGLAGIFRALGDSKSPLIFIAVACIINILADLLFVAHFKMGAVGAAWATVLAQLVSVIFSFCYLFFKPLPFPLLISDLKRSQYGKLILKVGTPIAIQDFLTQISFLILTSIVSSLGLIAALSVGIESKIFLLLSIFPNGFLQAISSFTAQNIGAGDFVRCKKGLARTLAIGIPIGFLTTFFYILFAPQLASIFEKDTATIQQACQYLYPCAVEFIFLPTIFILLGFFNGLGKTAFIMYQGILNSFLVRIPLSYLMLKLPNTSLFKIGLAVPIAGFISTLAFVSYYFWIHNGRSISQIQKKS